MLPSLFEHAILRRDIGALHVFSDTLNASGAPDARDPRAADFDAELTTDFRSLRLRRDTRHSIARSPLLGAYAAETVVLLQDEALRLVGRAAGQVLAHPALRQARETLVDLARQVIVNHARRNAAANAGTNGEDFHLGITDNGVELYATPISMLSFCRERIVSLFRIPNAGHPFFDGSREQFRSSVISLSRYAPEHLELVYRYPGRKELAEAIASGEERSIPEQEHALQLAFADRFGNVRARVRDPRRLRERLDACRGPDGMVGIRAGERVVPAFVATCLDEVPPGALGIYENVADGAGGSYIEIVRKWPRGGGEEDVEADAYATLGCGIGAPLEVVGTTNAGQKPRGTA